MFQMDFVWSAWYLPFCFIFSAALAWWMYDKLPIQLPKWVFHTSRTLRFIALFLLFVLLLEPVFTAFSDVLYPPVVVILTDNSESMVAHKDSAWVRKDLKNKLLQANSKISEKNVTVQWMQLGAETNTISSPESLNFQAQSSHLSGAFQEIYDQMNGQNLSAVLFISDGIPTKGNNPIYTSDKLKVPIFTAWVGDTVPPKDILIESVVWNELSYLDTETPIQINLKSFGMTGNTSTLNLSSQGKSIFKEAVSIHTNAFSKSITIPVKLSNVGIQAFDIDLSENEGESNFKNNHRKIYINVLENKIRIAVFGGGAHPDIGALHRAFSKDPRYSFAEFIRKSPTEFYKNPSNYSEYDLFILHNFPSTAADAQVLDKIYAESDNRKVPIFHIIGTQFNANIHPKQADYMALIPDNFRMSCTESFITFAPEFRTHSIWTFGDDFPKTFTAAPPLLRKDGEWKTRGEAQILATTRIKNVQLNYPFWAIQELNGKKNSVFVGEGLWRYRVHNYLEKSDFQHFDSWMQNLAQWLVTKTDKRKFRVFPEKFLFSGDEPAILKGQAYDDSYKPMSDVEMNVSVWDSKSNKFDFVMNEVSKGGYLLEMSNLEEGNYRFEAIGKKDGKTIGKDAGQFSIGRSAIEFIQLKSDADLMKQIANGSGGTSDYVQNLDKITADLLKLPSLKPLIETRKKTTPLHRFWWPALLILLALSSEWVLRKRFGLI